MTQTPASGPFAPVTTPTMSSPSVTSDGARPPCCDWHPTMASATNAAAPSNTLLNVIRPPPFRRMLQKAYCSVPDRKSTRLNSSHVEISYAVFCLKKKKEEKYTL